ncbi:nUDIX family hydrolase, partial [Mycobacterium xenopi 3993]
SLPGIGQRTREAQLNVLLWQRAREPQVGAGPCPVDGLRNDEDLTTSVRRQLAEKVDLRELAHLEQLAVFSDPHRVPGGRVIASTFLGLVPSPPPRNCHRHPLASGDRATADGVRPRSDGGPRPGPPGRQDVVHEYRIRLGAKGIRVIHTA